MTSHPLLLEINTRCWLADGALRLQRPLSLGTVPREIFEQWARLGFTHVWLMGVWSCGPKTRHHASLQPGLQLLARHHLQPNGQPLAIESSPFATSAYTVARELGGPQELQSFRQQLHRHGLRLMLDYIPNHIGLDHPWLSSHPHRFVQNACDAPGFFLHPAPQSPLWIAHGRDPFFPPWTDTAQLDYRQAETRQAMRRELLTVAAQCDAVRCDMAMLLLNDTFNRSWQKYPSYLPYLCHDEFWPRAIAEVKVRHPNFLFLAEVYWDLEQTLLDQGFDYTYDKGLYDKIVHHKPEAARSHLLQQTPLMLSRCAHFLENHDEPRVASLLSWSEQQCALLLSLALPGLRFVHEGEMEGRHLHTPVQLSHYLPETLQPAVQAHYHQLLAVLKKTNVGRGQVSLLQPESGGPDHSGTEGLFLVLWQGQDHSFDLVVIHAGPQPCQAVVRLAEITCEKPHWHLCDLLGGDTRVRSGEEISLSGLALDLPARSTRLFHFAPAAMA